MNSYLKVSVNKKREKYAEAFGAQWKFSEFIEEYNVIESVKKIVATIVILSKMEKDSEKNSKEICERLLFSKGNYQS